MQSTSLRTDTAQFLANLDNPNHAHIRAPQYIMQASKPAPTKVSAEWRALLDELYVGLEAPADERLVTSALEAASHIGDVAAKVNMLQDIAKRNRAEVEDIRDQYKNKDLIRTPREAIDKLNELKVQEKFLIPDAMAHNMQALVSKRNQKEHGKRFKTKRISSATPVLQVWRTR